MANSSTPIQISMIIPVRDHGELLDRLLSSIVEDLSGAEVGAEIIVVDDGSAEDLSGLCDAHGARRIRLETSEGPAHARNLGAAEAQGEVLLFFDADVICPRGLLDKVGGVMRDHPEACALSFINQRYEAGDGVVKNYGAAIEHYWFLDLMDGTDDVGEIRGFATRNAAIRRDAFEAIEGFDESFSTNAHEDYDFGKRLAAHAPTLLTRSPLVYHSFPDRLGRLVRNYWVRTVLFIPYVLKHRPKLDKAQATPAEAALRLVGGAIPIFLLAAALPIPYTSVWLAAAGAASLGYTFSARRFLGRALAWSGSVSFCVQALVIHWLTSITVSVASVWGLGAYALSPRAGTLKSRVD